MVKDRIQMHLKMWQHDTYFVCRFTSIQKNRAVFTFCVLILIKFPP